MRPCVWCLSLVQPKGVSVPPCGILPFRGFINYAAPICFMYEAQEPVRL